MITSHLTLNFHAGWNWLDLVDKRKGILLVFYLSSFLFHLGELSVMTARKLYVLENKLLGHLSKLSRYLITNLSHIV